MNITELPNKPPYLEDSPELFSAWENLKALVLTAKESELDYKLSKQAKEPVIELGRKNLKRLNDFLAVLDYYHTIEPIDQKARMKYHRQIREKMDQIIDSFSEELQTKHFGFEPFGSNIRVADRKRWLLQIRELYFYNPTFQKLNAESQSQGFCFSWVGSEATELRQKILKQIEDTKSGNYVQQIEDYQAGIKRPPNITTTPVVQLVQQKPYLRKATAQDLARFSQ